MQKLSTIRNMGVAVAAERLGLSKARVKQIAGKQIGEMVAGRYLFSESELVAFAKIPRRRGPKKRDAK